MAGHAATPGLVVVAIDGRKALTDVSAHVRDQHRRYLCCFTRYVVQAGQAGIVSC